MPIRFLLVRHGQSTWNADGRWQGLADPPLSEAGINQAYEAVAALGTVDAVISSTLVRAQQTAEILATGIGIGPVQLDPRLVESDAGVWTGLTRHQIEAQWPGWLEQHRRPDDFEDPIRVAARAIASLRDWAAEIGDGTAAVVTHSGVVRCLDRALGHDDAPVFNLAGRWYDVDGDHIVPGQRVQLIGDHSITPLGPAQTENA
jgi:broad specificity phosphatase PhoE